MGGSSSNIRSLLVTDLESVIGTSLSVMNLNYQLKVLWKSRPVDNNQWRQYKHDHKLVFAETVTHALSIQCCT